MFLEFILNKKILLWKIINFIITNTCNKLFIHHNIIIIVISPKVAAAKEFLRNEEYI